MIMWITCIVFIVITFIWMILIFSSLLTWSNELRKYSTETPPIDNSLFLTQCWLCIFILFVSLTFSAQYFKLYIYIWWIIVETIIFSLSTFYQTNNSDIRKMEWQFFYLGNLIFFMKDAYFFLMKNKIFFTINICFLYLSSMLSHNSHVFLYLNGLEPCIEIFDIFKKIWNLVLWR